MSKGPSFLFEIEKNREKFKRVVEIERFHCNH